MFYVEVAEGAVIVGVWSASLPVFALVLAGLLRRDFRKVGRDVAVLATACALPLNIAWGAYFTAAPDQDRSTAEQFVSWSLGLAAACAVLLVLRALLTPHPTYATVLAMVAAGLAAAPAALFGLMAGVVFALQGATLAAVLGVWCARRIAHGHRHGAAGAVAGGLAGGVVTVAATLPSSILTTMVLMTVNWGG
ncbi:hypothetical protein [Nocardiopsis oceani]